MAKSTILPQNRVLTDLDNVIGWNSKGHVIGAELIIICDYFLHNHLRMLQKHVLMA